MNSPLGYISKNIVRVRYLLVSACLLVGMLLAIGYLPVDALASDPSTKLLLPPSPTPDCTPPPDWSQTVRVKNPSKPSKQWTFEVDEPVMDVTLGFFYYQDYSKSGCPYDCSTGECQTDEGGKGKSPLGEFFVVDGKEGANRGAKKLQGRLTEGTYQVSFTATGNPGSINVGLNVRKNSVPTPTREPTDTPTPTEVTVTPTYTNTPTATATATATATGTQPTETPTLIPTDTPTGTLTPPSDTPTPTQTEESPTPTATKVGPTPPATLPPPTPIPGSPTPQVLIPVTGIKLGNGTEITYWALIPFGLGVLGLGIAFYGITVRLRRK